MASQSISDAKTRAHVVPGGPSFVYALPQLTIRKASVGSMNNNAYLLTDKQSGQQLLIDAAGGVSAQLDDVEVAGAEGQLVAVVEASGRGDREGIGVGVAS